MALRETSPTAGRDFRHRVQLHVPQRPMMTAHTQHPVDIGKWRWACFVMRNAQLARNNNGRVFR